LGVVREAKLVRVTVAILSISAFLGPVLLGMSEGGWDLRALFMPRYVPPRVWLEMEPPSIERTEYGLVVRFPIVNTGEVKLSIMSMEATAYGPKGMVIGAVELAEALTLTPQQSGVLALTLVFRERVIEELVPHLLEKGKVDVLLRGTAHFVVFGSTASTPFSTSFVISPADVGVKP